MSFHRSAFFREGSWMVIATFLGGICMFAVHSFGLRLSRDEYGVFQTMLNILNVVTIPALALQTVFARQTAAAISAHEEAQLRGTVRGIMRLSLFLWIALIILLFAGQSSLARLWKLKTTAPLWIVAGITLLQFWAPILMGVLQGRQNFLWFGWANIFNGAGRLLGVGIILVLLSQTATGAATGVLIGVALTFVVGFIHAKDLFAGESSGFALGKWLLGLLPLTLALGVTQFMLSADYLYFRANFPPDESGPYGGAGMIGRGLVMFSAPLVLVMFPKVARNVAIKSSGPVLLYTLGATLVLCTFGAAAATVMAYIMKAAGTNPAAWQFLPSVVLEKLRSPGGIFMAQWIPWFVWCMLPLALSNVLLNNLIAQSRFRIVPWLIAVALTYVILLQSWGSTVKGIILALGAANLLLLALSSLFTFRAPAAVEEP